MYRWLELKYCAYTLFNHYDDKDYCPLHQAIDKLNKSSHPSVIATYEHNEVCTPQSKRHSEQQHLPDLPCLHLLRLLEVRESKILSNAVVNMTSWLHRLGMRTIALFTKLHWFKHHAYVIHMNFEKSEPRQYSARQMNFWSSTYGKLLVYIHFMRRPLGQSLARSFARSVARSIARPLARQHYIKLT